MKQTQILTSIGPIPGLMILWLFALIATATVSDTPAFAYGGAGGGAGGGDGGPTNLGVLMEEIKRLPVQKRRVARQMMKQMLEMDREDLFLVATENAPCKLKFVVCGPLSEIQTHKIAVHIVSARRFDQEQAGVGAGIWIGVGAVVVAIASAIASITSVFVARHANSLSHAASQGQILSRWLDDYASSEIEEALRKLAEVRGEFSDQQWLEARECDAEMANSLIEESRAWRPGIHEYRRKILWFYQNAWHLHAERFLDDRAMRVITRTNGYSLLLEIVWPLSRLRYYEKMGEPLQEHYSWLEIMKRKFPPK